MHDLDGQTYLTTAETAKRLGLRPGTLRTYRHDGRAHVPWIKLGPSVLYREVDVDTYVGRRQRLSASATA